MSGATNVVDAMVVSARLAVTGARVRVVVTHHALARYIERVQPCADDHLAAWQIGLLFELGVVDGSPASWDGVRRRAPMYLTVGDVSFPLTVDAQDRELLVAVTCLVRGGLKTGVRPSCRREGQRAVVKRCVGRDGVLFYRRPAPGQLAFDVDCEDL